ncbi:MAG: SDR family oxidoreductase [Cardiobacteriaceae bacterium]|nr:SDR family oxidoreductase [Cardiobacteriaceae bacterium]
MRLLGKFAVITAAGQGIGRETALAFAKEGAKVIATDINQSALASLQAEHENIQTEVLDVTDSKAIAAFCEKYPQTNVLFNCAGWVAAGNIEQATAEDMNRSWQINVMSQFHLIQGFLPHMLKNGGASIINMASAASSVKGVPNRLAYSTSKAAVIGLTKALAADYVTQGIRANVICPGTVESPSLHERIATQAAAQGRDAESVMKDFVARQPMGRIGKTSEIATLAVYLASDESAFTTGAQHIIDGGWSN